MLKTLLILREKKKKVMESDHYQNQLLGFNKLVCENTNLCNLPRVFGNWGRLLFQDKKEINVHV